MDQTYLYIYVLVFVYGRENENLRDNNVICEESFFWIAPPILRPCVSCTFIGIKIFHCKMLLIIVIMGFYIILLLLKIAFLQKNLKY